MDLWKEVLFKVFKNKSRKKWKSVALNIILVDLGIKPGFLFDQWSTSTVEIDSLLTGLHQKQLIRNRLGIVCVDLDILIVSMSSIQSHPTYLNEPMLINVSSALDNPMIIDRVEAHPSCETIQTFHQCLRHDGHINTVVDGIVIPKFEVKISDKINPPCLFGLILGYPFVYWYDRTQGEENCLTMQKLRLFSVIGFEKTGGKTYSDSSYLMQDTLENKRYEYEHMNISGENQNCNNDCSSVIQGASSANHEIDNFPSVPVTSSSTSHKDKLEQQLANYASPNNSSQSLLGSKYSSENNQHVIFSFTIPECVAMSATKSHVHNWFSRWKDSVAWSSLFVNVWMEEESVEPQAVCL